jgi:enoyl-CoA hydratase/carnithine racemase
LTVATNDLLAHDFDGVGVVTLNRPEAINSLNQSMVTANARGIDRLGNGRRRAHRGWLD